VSLFEYLRTGVVVGAALGSLIVILDSTPESPHDVNLPPLACPVYSESPNV
jgi:hypothetical protein